jgi:hypothetical protein
MGTFRPLFSNMLEFCSYMPNTYLPLCRYFTVHPLKDGVHFSTQTVKESVELNCKYIQYITGRALNYKVNLSKELKILLCSATSE